MRLAGIVLYNPNLDRLKENICSVSSQVDEIVCIDNGSENIKDVLCLINKFSPMRISLIQNKANFGIAKALNQILDYAKDNKYDWVLSLDQDSIVMSGLLDDYESFINSTDKIGKLSGQLAMLSTVYSDRNSEMKAQTSGEYEEIKECITSASYSNVDIMLSVGGYDEKMFIDYVDYDLCATLKEKGYSIVRINKIGLIHEVGKAKTVKLFGVITNVHNESAFRKYHQIRNHLYYIKKHHDYINPIVEYRRIIKLFILTIIYENDKRNKLRFMFKGISDSRKMIKSIHANGE